MANSRNAVHNLEQDAKADAIKATIGDLVDLVREERFYGEFGITFSVQKGIIGHFTEKRNKTTR